MRSQKTPASVSEYDVFTAEHKHTQATLHYLLWRGKLEGNITDSLSPTYTLAIPPPTGAQFSIHTITFFAYLVGITPGVVYG